VRRFVGLLTIVLLAGPGCGDRATLSIPLTVELPTSSDMASLWAAGVSDVYLSAGPLGAQWHFDGADWGRLDIDSIEQPHLYFAGTGPDDIWLSDWFHYDGASWTAKEPSTIRQMWAIGCGPDGKLRGVGVAASTDGMALYQANGDTWTPIMNLPKGMMYPWIDPGTGQLFDQMLGDIDQTTKVRRFDGKRWVVFDIGRFYSSVSPFGVGDGVVYAVATVNTTVDVLRFDGTHWSPIHSGTSKLYGAGGTRSTGPLLGGEGAVYRVSASGLTPVITDDTMIFRQVQVVDGYLVLHGEYKKQALGSALLIRELPN